MTLLINLLSSFVFSILFTVLCLMIARKTGFLDVPDGHLKNQDKAVPYLGGLAIFGAVVCSLILVRLWENVFDIQDVMKYLLTVFPFFVIGILDDMFRWTPMRKFTFQILAALFMLYLFGGLLLPVLRLFLAVFFILLLVNTFNLIDVSDGLLSTVCLPIFFTLAVVAFFAKLFFTGILAQILLGATIGFLIFNWQPAKIYLGDAGSLFLGASTIFLLIPFLSLVKPLIFFFGSTLLLGVVLVETAGLVAIRTSLGIPFFKGSPHHFSIYLKKQGLSAAQVAIFSGLVGTVLALTAVSLVLNFVAIIPTLTFVGLGFCFWVYVVYFNAWMLKKLFDSYWFKRF